MSANREMCVNHLVITATQLQHSCNTTATQLQHTMSANGEMRVNHLVIWGGFD